MLGTSDAWSMSRSSHRLSVLYWRLSDFRSLWRAFSNPSERNIHKGSLPHSCQHVCWSLKSPMIFKWHSNWLGTFGFSSNYNSSNSSLLQKVCSSFATSLHYINRGSSIVLLLRRRGYIQSGLSMMSNPRQKVFPRPTPYWIRTHYL